MSKTAQKTTNKGLMPTWYYDAFKLRVMGLTYKAIATRLDKNEDWIRKLFSKNGQLYQHYRDWVQENKSDEMDLVNDMLFSHLPDSIRRLIGHAKDGDGFLSLAAIKQHMEYTLPKPKEVVDLNISFTTADLVKRVTERRKQKTLDDDRTRAGTISDGVAE